KRMQKPVTANRLHTAAWACQNPKEAPAGPSPSPMDRKFMDKAPARWMMELGNGWLVEYAAKQRGAMLRVLIVDDEAPARRYMRRLLEAAPNVRVEGEAATADQARRMIQDLRPDAVFLDIVLTRDNG